MDMRKLLKQADEMQKKMQRELSSTVTDATVGGGVVSVRMNGHKHLLAVKLDPEAIDPEDAGMLEDLIVAAVNEASRKIDDALKRQVGSLAASMPNLF